MSISAGSGGSGSGSGSGSFPSADKSDTSLLRAIQANKNVSIHSFYPQLSPYMELIQGRKSEFFAIHASSIPILSRQLFKDVNDISSAWSRTNEKNQNVIWQYLDSLYKLALQFHKMHVDAAAVAGEIDEPGSPSNNRRLEQEKAAAAAAAAAIATVDKDKPKSALKTNGTVEKKSAGDANPPSVSFASFVVLSSDSPTNKKSITISTSSPTSQSSTKVLENDNSPSAPPPLNPQLSMSKSGYSPKPSPKSVVEANSVLSDMLADDKVETAGGDENDGATVAIKDSPLVSPHRRIVPTHRSSYVKTMSRMSNATLRLPKSDSTSSSASAASLGPLSPMQSPFGLPLSDSTHSGMGGASGGGGWAGGSITGGGGAWNLQASSSFGLGNTPPSSPGFVGPMSPVSAAIGGGAFSPSMAKLRHSRMVSVSHDPRPRQLSSQQAGIVADLSKKNLCWHVLKPSAPNLVYPLLSIFPALVASSAASPSASDTPMLLHVHLSHRSNALFEDEALPPRLELCIENATLIVIALSDIQSVALTADGTQAPLVVSTPTAGCPLYITYKPGAKPLSLPNDGLTEEEKKSGSTASTTTALALPTVLSLASRKDNADVLLLLRSFATDPSIALGSGQVCIHKGNLEREKRDGEFDSWYGRLLDNRLVLYKSADVIRPSIIFSLSDADGISATIRKEKERLVMINCGGMKLTLRAESLVEREKWWTALVSEQTSKQPLDSLLKAGNSVAALTLSPSRLLLPNIPVAKKRPTSPNLLPAQAPATTHSPVLGAVAAPGTVATITTTIEARSNSITAPATPERSLPPKAMSPVLAAAAAAYTNNANAAQMPTPRSPSPTPGKLSGQLLAAMDGKETPAKTSGTATVTITNTAATAPSVPGVTSFSSGVRSEAVNPGKFSRMLIDQAAFFTYCIYFQEHPILFSTNILSSAEWHKQTPDGIFSKRDKQIKAIDMAIEALHDCIAASVLLLRQMRILATDNDEISSSSSQIGFAFPGFDSQVFDVGRMSVVSAWQFVSAAGRLAFGEDEWEGALQSRCVGKELMQASPDVSDLYAEGHVDEAKSIIEEATTLVFHNLCLANYLRSHNSTSKKFQLTSGDVLSWMNVCGAIESDANRSTLEQWSNVSYLYNAPIMKIDALINSDESTDVEAGGVARNGKNELRLLCDAVNFLIVLRRMMDHRSAKLSLLLEAINLFLTEHSVKSTKSVSKTNQRIEAVVSLKECVQKDLGELESLFAHLPNLSTLSQALKQQKKDEKATVLNSFLSSRPEKQELMKKGIMETRDTKEEKEKLKEKSKNLVKQQLEKNVVTQQNNTNSSAHTKQPSK